MIKKALLLCCALIFAQCIFSQNQTGLYLGLGSELGFMSLQKAFDWDGNVDGFRSGTFAQLGVDLEWRCSDRWSIKSGMYWSHYQYMEENTKFPEIPPFIDIFLPLQRIPGEEKRSFDRISIPLLLQYHLDDLVPGKLHVAIGGGLVSNVKTGPGNAIESFDFNSSIRRMALDAEVGPSLYLNIKSGMLMIAPVFRMALTDYAVNHNVGLIVDGNTSEVRDAPTLKPYSMGLQVGYLWHL